MLISLTLLVLPSLPWATAGLYINTTTTTSSEVWRNATASDTTGPESHTTHTYTTRIDAPTSGSTGLGAYILQGLATSAYQAALTTDVDEPTQVQSSYDSAEPTAGNTIEPSRASAIAVHPLVLTTNTTSHVPSRSRNATSQLTSSLETYVSASSLQDYNGTAQTVTSNILSGASRSTTAYSPYLFTSTPSLVAASSGPDLNSSGHKHTPSALYRTSKVLANLTATTTLVTGTVHGSPYLTPITPTWSPRKTAVGTASAPYATCNGITRVAGSFTTHTVLTASTSLTTTFDIVRTTFDSAALTSTLPEPSCSVGPAECQYLLKKWHVENPNNRLNQFGIGLFPGTSPPETYPHCAIGTGPGNVTDCFGCWLTGGNAQLFYWPRNDSLAEGTYDCPARYEAGVDLGDSSGTYRNASRPNSIVTTLTDTGYGNFTTVATFVSPTAYFSVGGLQAHNGCTRLPGSVVGTVIPVETAVMQSALLQLPSIPLGDPKYTTVMSVLANRAYDEYDTWFGTGWQFYGAGFAFTQTFVPVNPADLGKSRPTFENYFLVPTWPFGTGEEWSPAGYLYDADYRPVIRLDPEFKLGDPAWKDCYLNVAYDPPVALTAAATVDGPTEPTTTAASEILTTPNTAARPPSTPARPTPAPTSSSNSISRLTLSPQDQTSASTSLNPATDINLTDVASDEQRATTTASASSDAAGVSGEPAASVTPASGSGDGTVSQGLQDLAPVNSDTSAISSSAPDLTQLAASSSAAALVAPSEELPSSTPARATETVFSSQSVGDAIVSLIDRKSTADSEAPPQTPSVTDVSYATRSVASSQNVGGAAVSLIVDQKSTADSEAPSQVPSATDVSIGTRLVSLVTAGEQTFTAVPQATEAPQTLATQNPSGSLETGALSATIAAYPSATNLASGRESSLSLVAASSTVTDVGGQAHSEGAQSVDNIDAATSVVLQGSSESNGQAAQASQPVPVPTTIASSYLVTAGGQTITAIALPASLASGSAEQELIRTGENSQPSASAGTATYDTIGGPRVPALLVGSQTVKAGGSAVVTNGLTISLATSGAALLVDTMTQSLETLVAPSLTESAKITGVAYESTTLRLGDSILHVSGATYSLDAAGTGLLIDGTGLSPSPHIVTKLAPTVPATVLGLALGTTTLSPGGPALTISGKTYSLDPAGTALAIDGTTNAIGEPVTISLAGPTGVPGLALGSTTIWPGHVALVVSDTTYSLDSAGTALAVDGTTHAIAAPATPSPENLSGAAVEGIPFLLGTAITISGITYSLDAGGTALVIDGATHVLSSTLAPDILQTTYIQGSVLTAEALPTAASLAGGVDALPTQNPETRPDGASEGLFITVGQTNSNDGASPTANHGSADAPQNTVFGGVDQNVTSLPSAKPTIPEIGLPPQSTIKGASSSQRGAAARSSTRPCVWALVFCMISRWLDV
ncbi:hypothetical protein LTR10_000979 [Elasticomyces elasticus]|nr:hypothetical protein LTR10_000979 [Elasticomyces elasticus]KAK4979772.1 hypothetical protein LTR42_000079 [Elasticomyces elasticus]